MLYSLSLADEVLKNNICIISYTDLFYPCEAVKGIIQAPGEIVISYDSNWLSLWSKRFDNPLDDAETFKIDEQGYLIEIGKNFRSF